jgi:hypothetical protein
MSFDVRNFHPYNIIDSCAIQNVLSSLTLYSASLQAKCGFVCTGFVHYECVVKNRNKESAEDKEIQKRFSKAINSGEVKINHLDIEDLQDIHILENRKKLGMGELSSIAVANKYRQVFMTDDLKARKLGLAILGSGRVQTTPQLFGWLIFGNFLLDSDKDRVIKEHESLEKRIPLTSFFENLYLKALEAKCMK